MAEALVGDTAILINLISLQGNNKKCTFQFLMSHTQNLDL